MGWDCGAGIYLQKWEHPLLDVLLASLASTVSVEFYTAFLPLLFWVLSHSCNFSLVSDALLMILKCCSEI